MPPAVSVHEIDPRLIAEGLIYALEAASVVATLFIAYVLHLRRDRPRKNIWATLGFFALIWSGLIGAHALAETSDPYGPSGGLVVALALGVALYFSVVRDVWNDDRIRYAVLLWAACWLLTALLLLILWRGSSLVQFKIAELRHESFAQYVSTFAQMIGIIIAATMVIVTNRHNASEAEKTSRQQIYQTLELESVQLFRFECEHPELVEPLWISSLDEAGRRRNLSDTELDLLEYRLTQHICQTLNLFEIACRFRKQKIMEPEVFGSWMIWMLELCTRLEFRNHWKGEQRSGTRVELNYVAELRDIINAGIHFSAECEGEYDDDDRRRSFFKYVANLMYDDDESHWREIIEKWPHHKHAAGAEIFDRFWTHAGKPDALTRPIAPPPPQPPSG
ncbi:MAG: hypothetical protein H3C55_04100 [Pseudorhodoplanes sp.]|nr:hypothetical protein [Pseudorhodoplanes sp.]MBW7948514.1 hypothetical protein [Pseudorhodoplanes sp.]